jgi:pectate lyase
MNIPAPFLAVAMRFMAFGLLLLAVLVNSVALADAANNSYWGAHTSGGRGGQIIRVTNLQEEGEGSFKWAVEQKGARIVVFEVGGVIDLNKSNIKITEPNLTIAGQTAPSPGITLIRGGLSIRADDVIVQHLRVRPGDGYPDVSRWDTDALNTSRAKNVLIEHCSLTWGTDENLTAGGPRQEGNSPEQWRAATSKNITLRNNIVAEGLLNATHPKGEHSKGVLVHDNVERVLITGNLMANNYERSPLLKGGASALVLNNLIYNPGQRAIHYNLIEGEWRGEKVLGKMTIVGNVLRAGPSTEEPIALLMFGGQGGLELYMKDNLALNKIGQALPQMGYYYSGEKRIHSIKKAPKGLKDFDIKAPSAVEDWVLARAGARPWDRDYHDNRVLADVAEGRGKLIDSQNDVGGYPSHKQTMRAFSESDWDLSTMQPIDKEKLYTSIWP